MADDYQTITFKTDAEWRQWLSENHASTDGIWLKIYKKSTGMQTFTYAEALDHALCYGWIDGIRKSGGIDHFLQKFTPRRKTSIWSKRNIEHIERLTTTGLMTPAGQAEVDRAKQDGRWDAAYDTQRDMKIPDSFMEALAANPAAAEFFKTLNKTNLFAIGFRLQTAKTEATRLRRQQKIIDRLAAGEKLV